MLVVQKFGVFEFRFFYLLKFIYIISSLKKFEFLVWSAYLKLIKIPKNTFCLIYMRSQNFQVVCLFQHIIFEVCFLLYC